MRIYVASSWRNGYQPLVVKCLRSEGFDVYDFKNPEPGNHGFHWSDIDKGWKNWNTTQFIDALEHPIAREGFDWDFGAMLISDACVLVLPCGRSSHIEAGWFAGIGRPLIVFQPTPQEPELMYLIASYICDDIESAIKYLKEKESADE